MKRFYVILIFILFMIISACSNNDEGSSSQSKDNKDVIKWDLSLWGGPREWTTPVEAWAEDMYELTDGGWEITVHYGEALSDANDHLQGVSTGVFEAAGVAPFYTPGILPLNEVMDLPFISPLDSEEMSLLQKAAWEHPAILEEMHDNNIVPLLHSIPSNQDYSGNKKIETVDDFQGLRLAGMSARVGKVLEEFGAIPNLMPSSELYGAIDSGTLDGVLMGYSYAHYSMGFYEVSKYVTEGINPGAPASFYVANKDAWDQLPEEYQEIHNEYIEDWHVKSTEPYYEADDEYIPIFKEDLEFVEFPEEERDKLLEVAEATWDEWVKEAEDKGPAKEILEYILESREEISGY